MSTPDQTLPPDPGSRAGSEPQAPWGQATPDTNGPFDQQSPQGTAASAAPSPYGPPQNPSPYGPATNSSPYAGGPDQPMDASQQQGSSAIPTPAGFTPPIKKAKRRRAGGIVGALVALLVILAKSVGIALVVSLLHRAPALPDSLDGMQHLTTAKAVEAEDSVRSDIKDSNPRLKVNSRIYSAGSAIVVAMTLNASVDTSDDQWRDAKIDPSTVRTIGKDKCGATADHAVMCLHSTWWKSAGVLMGPSGDDNTTMDKAAKHLDSLWGQL